MSCARKCGDCCACLSPIPNGGTCETACAHVARCKAIFGQKGTETCCQWIPSRFRSALPTPAPEPDSAGSSADWHEPR